MKDSEARNVTWRAAAAGLAVFYALVVLMNAPAMEKNAALPATRRRRSCVRLHVSRRCSDLTFSAGEPHAFAGGGSTRRITRNSKQTSNEKGR